MCGIAGVVASAPLSEDVRERVIRMRESLAHRGPDEAGLYADPSAVLGHRRLSIVDLSAGQQPLGNEDGSITVVFNGEIYNHADLRRSLEAHGHRFRTRCDTEAIVHAYEQWGDDCVDRFRGMFAFAIWDRARRRLLLVRDRLGIKPLYWARLGDRVLFASEIKALLASGLIEPQPRLSAFGELFGTGSTAGATTLFRGIHALPPAHRLVFEHGGVRLDGYWDVAAAAGETAAPREDVVARFRDLFTESVRLRLMSDVPLGVFLSGGLDSSAIAATMARLSSRPIQAFSVAFKERACNELAYARTVADAIGAASHEVVIDDRDFFGALPRLIWHEDEPIAHPSSVPLFFVSKLARRQVTVVLTGEGSDELFAGYGRYPRIAWNWRAGGIYERVVPEAVRSMVTDRLLPKLPRRLRRYARRSFLGVERTPAAMAFDTFAPVPLAAQRALLSPDLQAVAGLDRAYAAPVACFDRPGAGASLLDRLLYADLKTYLVELLMKQDQMSMAASIESRVPFLDHVLVEFAASLPDEWKLSGWTGKRVLREAMKGTLPAAVLDRPKMGFPVPFDHWMRGGWNDVAADVLLDRRSRERGLIQPVNVARLLADHAAGRVNEATRIWSLLNLELWFRTFIDREGVQTLPLPAAPALHTDAHSLAQV
jgi:asparagine synthase (glutamine-hydrolysing)